MMRFILAMLAVSVATISNAFATPDPESYRQALQAGATVRVLKMAAPPSEVRELLLEQSRPEDLTFVKSMLVYWKRNSNQNMATEFNHVILRDQTGTETFRMFPVENSPGKYMINGRAWTAPEKGSVSASLHHHLAHSKETSSIFELVSRAYAEAPKVMDELTAFMNFMNMSNEKVATATAKYLIEADTKKHFSIQNNAFQDFFAWAGVPAPEVSCGKDSASGKLVIEGEAMTFTVRADDKVVLTPYSSKKPFLASVANDARAAVSYQACADASCLKTQDGTYDNITHFLRMKTPVEADVAWTFYPRDGDQNRRPIKYDCPDENDCDHMYIKGRETLSDSDRKRAEEAVVRGNQSLQEAKVRRNASIQAIRPLYTCCLSEKCKTMVSASGLRLKAAPATGAHTAR